ncbi:MAG: hypothetical protein DU429_02765 [Candidatus Tokpelaia sp.]|nr:MAG: hypothetical protein DU430_05515 [Candidatus Tokpelaia sp.]KAA6207394.1 MAG: hypothetical protein DU429_02765 [Candidatus Tokpelaia sp.]
MKSGLVVFAVTGCAILSRLKVMRLGCFAVGKPESFLPDFAFFVILSFLFTLSFARAGEGERFIVSFYHPAGKFADIPSVRPRQNFC